MTHSKILPDCAADLATLSTTQEAIGKDMHDLKEDVKSLSEKVNEFGIKLDEVVIPAVKAFPELAKQPAEHCPIYRAFIEGQKKTLENSISGKMNNNWLQTFVNSKLVKAIAALIITAMTIYITVRYGT